MGVGKVQGEGRGGEAREAKYERRRQWSWRGEDTYSYSKGFEDEKILGGEGESERVIWEWRQCKERAGEPQKFDLKLTLTISLRKIYVSSTK